MQTRNRRRFTGLTGGIASGKSRAAFFLSVRHNLLLYSADTITHDLLDPGGKGWQFFKEVYPEFISRNGTVNKPYLRSALFADEELRETVNSGIHPLVWDALMKKVKLEQRSSRYTAILVEVPLLYEAGWQDRFDEIIVVYAESNCCRNRLMERDKASPARAGKELTAQLPMSEKCLLADHVINNSWSWSQTVLGLLHLGDLLWPESLQDLTGQYGVVS